MKSVIVVTSELESVTISGVDSISVDSECLEVLDKAGKIIAVFAAGHWRSCRSESTSPSVAANKKLRRRR